MRCALFAKFELGFERLRILLFLCQQVDIFFQHFSGFVETIGLVVDFGHITVCFLYFAFDSYFQMLFRTGQITGLVAADTIPMIIGGIAWRLFDQLFKGRFGFRVLTFIV